MDSPDSSKPPAAASSPEVVQESPVYSYISKLSPIKPVNDVRIAEAYRELNFPPPSPVFASPCIDPLKKENLLKRSQHLSPEVGKSVYCTGSIKELSENTSLSGPAFPTMAQSIPCIDKSAQHYSSTSGSVDEFLADPMEECVNSSGSSDLCLNREESGGEGPARSPHFSSSDCINWLMASPMECSKSIVVPDRSSDLSHALQNDYNVTNKIIMKPGSGKNNVRKDKRTKDFEILISACQTEEGLIGKDPSVLVKIDQTEDSAEEADKDSKNNERSLNQCSESVPENTSDLMKNDSSVEPTSDVQNFQSLVQTATDNSSTVSKHEEHVSPDHVKVKSTSTLDHSHDIEVHLAETGQLDCTPQLQTEPFRSVHAEKGQHGDSGAMSNISAEEHISHGKEFLSSKLQLGCQRQWVMRKCLRFEAASTQLIGIGCNRSSQNVTNIESNAESPAVNLENLNSFCSESTTSSNNQFVRSANFSGHAFSRLSNRPHNQTSEAYTNKVNRSVRNNGSSSMTAPRPSGIGLHLNSIGKGVAMNCNVNMQLEEKDLEKDYMNEGVDKALPPSNPPQLEDSKTCSSPKNTTGKFSVNSTVISDQSFACSSAEKRDENEEESQAIMLSHASARLLSPLNVNPLKCSLPPKFIDHMIAPRNMKRPPSEDACVPEDLNELSPRKKRKKAPENEGCKRCNCKKTKCLKLYCDCFAAGVYCAEACACQGCFNRLEYEDTVLETRQQIEIRNPLAFAPKVVTRVLQSPRTSGEDGKHMTPTAARHKRGCNCKKSQCLKKYCECFQAGVGCSLGCRCDGCKNTYGRKDGDVEITETEHIKGKDEKWESTPVEIGSEMLNHEKCPPHLSPLTPLLDGCNGVDVPKSQFPARRYFSSPESASSALTSYGKAPISPKNSGDGNKFVKAREGNWSMVLHNQALEGHNGAKGDSFSPGWDILENICNLSPLPNPSPSATRLSAASDIRECLRAPLFQGSDRPAVSILRWRSSPVTPMPQFGETKFILEPDSESEPHKIQEDDTPDILKDTHMHNQGLKTSSPNKKRVSPPYKCLNEMRSSSSPSLKGSRKFILQSVPSFPSLTPYSNNSKGHGI